MKRRHFITLLSSTISGAMWPRSGLSMTPLKRPLIGFLAATSKAMGEPFLGGFPQGMRSLGYLEGRDFGLEARYANDDLSRLPSLADELVRLKPDVIVAGPTVSALAVRHATTTIPIVGVNLTDPIGSGLIASEARPGTNVTGSLLRLEGLAGKLVEIARDLEPSVSVVGIFANVSNPSSAKQQQEAISSATRLGLRVILAEVRKVEDIGPAFQTFLREGAKAVIIGPDFLYLATRRQIAAHALVSRIPTIHCFREEVEAGGLLSYGIDLRASYARAANFVVKILNGEKPADLPIELPTKLLLVINRTTAEAIELTIPPMLLARADEVIE